MRTDGLAIQMHLDAWIARQNVGEGLVQGRQVLGVHGTHDVDHDRPGSHSTRVAQGEVEHST